MPRDERATAEYHRVVVGMKTKPHPKRAIGALKKAGISYKYLGYGSTAFMSSLISTGRRFPATLALRLAGVQDPATS